MITSRVGQPIHWSLLVGRVILFEYSEAQVSMYMCVSKREWANQLSKGRERNSSLNLEANTTATHWHIVLYDECVGEGIIFFKTADQKLQWTQESNLVRNDYMSRVGQPNHWSLLAGIVILFEYVEAQ